MSYRVVPYKGSDPALQGVDMIEFAADELKAAGALQVPKFVTEGYVFPSLALTSPRSSKFVLTSNFVAAAVQHAVTAKPETTAKPFPWAIVAGIAIALVGAAGAVTLRRLRAIKERASVLSEAAQKQQEVFL